MCVPFLSLIIHQAFFLPVFVFRPVLILVGKADAFELPSTQGLFMISEFSRSHSLLNSTIQTSVFNLPN